MKSWRNVFNLNLMVCNTSFWKCPPAGLSQRCPSPRRREETLWPESKASAAHLQWRIFQMSVADQLVFGARESISRRGVDDPSDSYFNSNLCLRSWSTASHLSLNIVLMCAVFQAGFRVKLNLWGACKHCCTRHLNAWARSRVIN